MTEDEQLTIQRDEGTLRTVLSHFCYFDYDKAREMVDKEKDARKGSNSPEWVGVLNCISQLASLEKLYMDLDFLLPRGFLRKESPVRFNYETLLTDLAEIDKKKANSRPLGKGYKHITTHLVLFIQTRLLLLTFYEKIASFPGNKNSTYDDLILHIEEIIMKNHTFSTDIINTPIRQLLDMECALLSKLFHSVKYMQEYNFLNALMSLNGASEKLHSWLAMVQTRETRKYSFGSGFLRTSSQPCLFRWFNRVKAAFVAKFSLYFYQPLAEQTTHLEMKNSSSKLVCDHAARIQNFHRRSDAQYFCLVLDAQGLESYTGKGYKHASASQELTGFELFMDIYCFPTKPKEYWHCVSMRVSDKNLDDGEMDKIMCFHDNQNNATFFTCRIEPRYTMVLIFDGKKSEKDATVREFLIDMALSLRCSRIFSGIRQR